MRNIKFRFWNSIKNAMYQDVPVYDGVDINDQFENMESDNIVIMQFTGLIDREGKEIYEGDIVTGSYHNLIVDYSKLGSVEMGYSHDSDGWSCGLTYGWITTNGSSLSDLDDCEIVGNIYENPELLDK